VIKDLSLYAAPGFSVSLYQLIHSFIDVHFPTPDHRSWNISVFVFLPASHLLHAVAARFAFTVKVPVRKAIKEPVPFMLFVETPSPFKGKGVSLRTPFEEPRHDRYEGGTSNNPRPHRRPALNHRRWIFSGRRRGPRCLRGGRQGRWLR